MRLDKVKEEEIGVYAAVITDFPLLATVLTHPLSSHFSSHTPAHKDFGKHVGKQSSFWQPISFADCMTMHSNGWPFFTDTAFYPYGVDLGCSLLRG